MGFTDVFVSSISHRISSGIAKIPTPSDASAEPEQPIREEDAVEAEPEQPIREEVAVEADTEQPIREEVVVEAEADQSIGCSCKLQSRLRLSNQSGRKSWLRQNQSNQSVKKSRWRLRGLVSKASKRSIGTRGPHRVLHRTTLEGMATHIININIYNIMPPIE